jgi:hypothetical protein
VLVPWQFDTDPDPWICTLDYESVFVFGPFSFWQWLSRCQQKIRFFLANKLTQSKQAHHTPLNQRSVFLIAVYLVFWFLNILIRIQIWILASLHWIMDPDPSLFGSGFQDANKK